jgi:F0F1-type ATP synthase membrane subunit c/vacuolar-type H+-ATPase subunit K
MGALLMTGLACFGAAIAIGILASSTTPTIEVKRGAPSARGLAIILMAFCSGIAVLGVVIGLLAVNAGLVADPSSGVLAAGGAVVGAVIGIGLIAANWSHLDRYVAWRGIAFAAPLGLLGVVVAVLANIFDDIGTGTLANWPFVVLAPASALAALAIGVTGAGAIRSLPGVDETATKSIVAAQISRCALFQAVAIGASTIGILLIMLA